MTVNWLDERTDGRTQNSNPPELPHQPSQTSNPTNLKLNKSSHVHKSRNPHTLFQHIARLDTKSRQPWAWLGLPPSPSLSNLLVGGSTPFPSRSINPVHSLGPVLFFSVVLFLTPFGDQFKSKKLTFECFCAVFQCFFFLNPF